MVQVWDGGEVDSNVSIEDDGCEEDIGCPVIISFLPC